MTIQETLKPKNNMKTKISITMKAPDWYEVIKKKQNEIFKYEGVNFSRYWFQIKFLFPHSIKSSIREVRPVVLELFSFWNIKFFKLKDEIRSHAELWFFRKMSKYLSFTRRKLKTNKLNLFRNRIAAFFYRLKEKTREWEREMKRERIGFQMRKV